MRVPLAPTGLQALTLPRIGVLLTWRPLVAPAVLRGEITDLIAYLIANAKPLGLLKRQRKRLSLELLLDLTNPVEA